MGFCAFSCLPGRKLHGWQKETIVLFLDRSYLLVNVFHDKYRKAFNMFCTFPGAWEPEGGWVDVPVPPP